MQNRDQIILNIQRDFIKESRVKSILSSVENPTLSGLGIDLKLFTDKGSLSFRVRVSEYKAEYMFIKTSSSGGHDGLFDCEADFIIQIYKDGAVIYETKPLINCLKKVLPNLPGIPASGRYINSASCIGKLVSLELIESTTPNFMKLKLADIIDNKYKIEPPTNNAVNVYFGSSQRKEGVKQNVSTKSCPLRFREFMELRRKSRKIASNAISKLDRKDF